MDTTDPEIKFDENGDIIYVQFEYWQAVEVDGNYDFKVIGSYSASTGVVLKSSE